MPRGGQVGTCACSCSTERSTLLTYKASAGLQGERRLAAGRCSAGPVRAARGVHRGLDAGFGIPPLGNGSL